MFLRSKPLFFYPPLPSTGWLIRRVLFVSAIPTQSYKVTKQSINKCWSRQERTEEVFVWSACTMTFSPTSRDSSSCCTALTAINKQHFATGYDKGAWTPLPRKYYFLCRGMWSQIHTIKSQSVQYFLCLHCVSARRGRVFTVQNDRNQ